MLPVFRRSFCVLAFGVAALAAPAYAAAPLTARLAHALAVAHVEQREVGAIALDLATGNVVFARHPDLALAPASNEKLALTYAALVRLGPSFRFRTEVLGEGVRQGAAWDGDIVLRGYGDPTLKTMGLIRLVAQLKAAGIRRVAGSVVGDESYFDGRRGVDGWKASFYGDECPPLSALSINRGRVKGILVSDPALATARRFRELLVARGISVAGSAAMRPVAEGAVPLASIDSEPLGEIIRFMDHDSDNYTAEILLKELGAAERDTGTSRAGAAVVTGILAEAGVPVAGVHVVDGSGLSRSDRLTVRALASILRLAWTNVAVRAQLVRALPVAGVSGTLEHRLRRVPARGHVRAKTGTTDIASALSGYVGNRFAFALIHNGHPVWAWYAREAQDNFVQTLARAERS